MGYSMRLRGAQSVFETNKTLRNTFFLLALSLLPTIGGVFLGTAIGLPAMMASSPWLFLIGFLVAAFLVIGAIHATSESGIVFVPLTALTLMMGAVLSGVITATLKFSNGPELITLAFAGTIAMLAGCGVYASTTKRDFSSMGGFLFGSLIALIALGLLNMVMQVPILSLVFSGIAMVLFTVYLIYDIQRVVQGGETNYVLATVAIYLDLVNIFSNLLNILGWVSGED